MRVELFFHKGLAETKQFVTGIEANFESGEVELEYEEQYNDKQTNFEGVRGIKIKDDAPLS